MIRKIVLPKIAKFIRQLSLFDQIEAVETPNSARMEAQPSEPDHPPIQTSNPSLSPGFQSLCVGSFAHIEVMAKPRMWDSWRVFWTRRNESLRLEVPSHLDSAPESVKLAVLNWACLVSRRGAKRNPALKLERTRLETEIRAYLRAPAGEHATSAHKGLFARNRRRLQRMNPKGRHHDLTEALKRVNEEYFQGALQVTVTWSARLGGLSTHSMAQDGEGNAYHLISISRGYDSPEVTPEILDGVVYHECLHAAIPPEHRNGRRIVHGPEFRRRERAYAHFEIWRQWHRDGLPKSLKRLRRAGK